MTKQPVLILVDYDGTCAVYRHLRKTNRDNITGSYY